MAQAGSIPSTSRRNFLASAAAATAILAPNIAMAGDAIDVMAREFDANERAFDLFNLKYPDSEAPHLDAIYQELFAKVSASVDRIECMTATDLKSFRLKARAVRWCNKDFDHLHAGSSDHEITRSILYDLLALPAI